MRWLIKSRIVIAILAILLLSNCSSSKRAQRLVREANRKIEKAKKLDPSVSLLQVDTLEVPIYIESSKVDTVFKSEPGDTVIIENERVKVKYVKLPGDSVFIQGEAKQDTVYVKVPSEKEIIIAKESYRDLVQRLLGINGFWFFTIHVGLGLILLLILARKLRLL